MSRGIRAGLSGVARGVRTVVGWMDPVRFMVPGVLLVPDVQDATREAESPAVIDQLLPPAPFPAPLPVKEVAEERPEQEARAFTAQELLAGVTLQFAATYPKDPARPETNEDAWAVHEASGATAIFDGATESFAARRWVGILVEQWQQNGSLDLRQAQLRYAESTVEEMSWAQQAAAERGSFSTVAAWIPTGERAMLLTVGDSAVLGIRDNTIVIAEPFAHAHDFASTPDALASSPDLLGSGEELLSAGTRPWAAGASEATDSNPVDWVMLATDAVAAWLLVDDDDREARVRAVLQCHTDVDWRELVLQERVAQRMKVDDATIVVLRIGDQP